MVSLTKKFTWFQIVVMASMVAFPLLSFGQTNLPHTGGDGVGFNGAGPGTVVNYFANGTNSWISAIEPVAKALFWALATIDFTWTCITLVIQHSELQGWMAGFIRKILTIGFFAVLLQNGAAWISAVVNFFIGLGGTAGGVDVSTLSASDIMGAGVQLAGHMLKAAASSAASGGATNPIGLLVNGIGSLAPALILALGAFLIVIAYVVIALHFVMAMVEAYVVVGAGYVFLGFGGSRWTVPYTEKYMGMVVSAGVRIMVLELLIGLGQTLYTQWVATADAIATTPDILDGGSFSSGWTGVQAEFGLVASILIYALLCWTIPQIAANVASGGLSMSGGDVLSAGAAAGTAAFAGANYGSSSSASNAGSQSDVQQVAQAAAIKGAEVGVTAAAAAATGGVGAVGAEVAGGGGGVSSMAGDMAGKSAVDAAPSSLDANPSAKAAEESVPSSLDASAVYEGRDGGDGSGEQKGSGNGSPGASDGESQAAEADGNQAVNSGNTRTERNQNADATRANEAPGIDAAQQQFQDAVKNAGQQARLEALEQGKSPQEALLAEKEARATAAKQGKGLLGRTGAVANNLERALNRMPDDGGRINPTTPNLGHDNGE